MRMYEWNNIDLVFTGLGGGVWTTDDIHIGVYSIFRSFMVCAWIENGLWAEKVYSYDWSWGRSAGVMAVKGF
jgi:hypothetical protein